MLKFLTWFFVQSQLVNDCADVEVKCNKNQYSNNWKGKTYMIPFFAFLPNLFINLFAINIMITANISLIIFVFNVWGGSVTARIHSIVSSVYVTTSIKCIGLSLSSSKKHNLIYPNNENDWGYDQKDMKHRETKVEL